MFKTFVQKKLPFCIFFNFVSCIFIYYLIIENDLLFVSVYFIFLF